MGVWGAVMLESRCAVACWVVGEYYGVGGVDSSNSSTPSCEGRYVVIMVVGIRLDCGTNCECTQGEWRLLWGSSSTEYPDVGAAGPPQPAVCDYAPHWASFTPTPHGSHPVWVSNGSSGFGLCCFGGFVGVFVGWWVGYGVCFGFLGGVGWWVWVWFVEAVGVWVVVLVWWVRVVCVGWGEGFVGCLLGVGGGGWIGWVL